MDAYCSRNISKIQHIKTNLCRLVQVSGESISNFFERGKKYYDNLLSFVAQVLEEDLVDSLLRGLAVLFIIFFHSIKSRHEPILFIELFGFALTEEVQLEVENSLDSSPIFVNMATYPKYRGHGRRGGGGFCNQHSQNTGRGIFGASPNCWPAEGSV